MVNTFLVHSNFTISASWLDNRRLGKQRVEAYQILLLLEDLNALSICLNIPRPTDPTLIRAWITQIDQTYKRLPYFYIRSDTMMIRTDGKHQSEGRFIKLGFVHHPAVRMWVGYEDALREYITAHIQEWIKRKFTNTMTMYDIKDSPRPPWMMDGKIYQNHRAALLEKEMSRSEAPWYINRKEFTQVGSFPGYIWPI